MDPSTWINLIIQIIMMAFMLSRMKVKNPNAQPAGLADFTFPTANERPVQVLFGTRKLGGSNVIWYGDLSTKKIYEKIKMLFTSKKTVIGYKYYMGLQLGICHGPGTTLKAVYFDDDLGWSGNIASGSFSIDKPDLMGGEGKNGGVGGTVHFYPGDYGQAPNAYLQQKVGVDVVSGMKGLTYAVFQSFYLGNSTTPPKISFVCSRFSPSPTGRAELEQIGDDCNPAYVIYEVLTDKRFGASIPKEKVNIENIEQVAKTLFDEDFGVSLQIDSSTATSDVIDSILSAIQGSLITDPQDGKLKIKLIRADYDYDTLPILSPRNVKSISDFSNGSLDTAIDEVKLKFIDASNDFTERTVQAQNLGVFVHKGDVDSKTMSAPCISRADIAQRVCERELTAVSVPLSTVSVVANRSMFAAEVGDPVRFTWPANGIENMIMRVTSVDLGRPGDSAVRLSLAQDVFGVTTSIYSDGSDRVIDEERPEPLDPASVVFMTAPAPLTDKIGMTKAVLCLAEAPAGALDYRLVTRYLDDSYWSEHGNFPFTPVCYLGEALPELGNIGQFDDHGAGFGPWDLESLVLSGDVLQLDSYALNERRDGMGLLYIEDQGREEWIVYSLAIQNADGTCTLKNIKRGLFGTWPVAHEAGAKVWAVSEGHGLTTHEFYDGNRIELKLRVMNQYSRQALDVAKLHRHDFVDTNWEPQTPGALSVVTDGGKVFNGEFGPGDVPVAQWGKRDGTLQEIRFFEDDDENTEISSNTLYQIDIFDSEDGDVIFSIRDMDDYYYSYADQPKSPEGWVREYLRFEITAYKVKDGIEHRARTISTVIRRRPFTTETGVLNPSSA